MFCHRSWLGVSPFKTVQRPRDGLSDYVLLSIILYFFGSGLQTHCACVSATWGFIIWICNSPTLPQVYLSIKVQYLLCQCQGTVLTILSFFPWYLPLQCASQTIQLFSVLQLKMRQRSFCNSFLVLGYGLVSLAVFCGSGWLSSMQHHGIKGCTFPNGIVLCGVSWFFHGKEKLLVLLFFYRISTSEICGSHF